MRSSVDATTITVRDALLEEFPGTGSYAAIQVHKVRSVGCGAPAWYHCSPARAHKGRHLTIDESWRGYGLLAHLADASLDRLRACDTHGVRNDSENALPLFSTPCPPQHGMNRLDTGIA